MHGVMIQIMGDVQTADLQRCRVGNLKTYLVSSAPWRRLSIYNMQVLSSLVASYLPVQTHQEHLRQT